MSVFLEKIIFVNRAPFEKLELDFVEKEIAVLCAVNGKGKTTILSHIVDAFHEIARPHFQNEFEDKQNKYYRISSAIDNIDMEQPSYVYVRFRGVDDEIFDYLDVRNVCTEEQYNAAISLPEKIPYTLFSENLRTMRNVKQVSSNLIAEKARLLFSNNLLTYFPSYRYEIPGYLNNPYKTKLDFRKDSGFSGFLPNPLEVVTGLPQLLNWIMDIVLDMQVGHQETRPIFESLNNVINRMLISKGLGTVRLGIGARSMGAQRVQIVTLNGQRVYPTLFNLSSGETALLCIFAELIRQSDNCRAGVNLESISGIVLIDEVEKHLHIRLQKEILPKLLNLFPNVQFIVSSHSPFLSMGLAEEAQSRSKIVDLDNFGITKDPTANTLYTEAYELMIHENDRFKNIYQALVRKVKEGIIPLIVTEGKTDVIYLKKAKEMLGIDQEVEFFEINEEWGDSKLKVLLEQLSKVSQPRKIIGIFDRDVSHIVSQFEREPNGIKVYGNNVYAFCIPIPDGKERYENISLEFYFGFKDLQKEKDGKRLYFSNEVELRLSTSRSGEKNLIRLNEAIEQDETVKKVYDLNIGELDWIHSKARFAELVATNEDFAADFDFDSFNLIFNRVSEITRL